MHRSKSSSYVTLTCYLMKISIRNVREKNIADTKLKSDGFQAICQIDVSLTDGISENDFHVKIGSFTAREKSLATSSRTIVDDFTFSNEKDFDWFLLFRWATLFLSVVNHLDVVLSRFLSDEGKMTLAEKILSFFLSKNLRWSQSNLEFLLVVTLFVIFSGISKLLLSLMWKESCQNWRYSLTYEEKQECCQDLRLVRAIHLEQVNFSSPISVVEIDFCLSLADSFHW